MHQEQLKSTGFYGKQGAGCLIYSRKTGRFLIIKRSSVVEQPNTWANIGGAIDNNEVPLETSIREAKEETKFNYNILKSHLLFVFVKGSFRYFNFLHEIEEEFIPILNNESSDYKWVVKDTLLNLSNAIDVHFGLKACLKNTKALNIINSL